MSTTDDLEHLCRHYGIASTYQDIQGRQHHATDATRRALLRALGVPAGDAETERTSLETALARDWRRILPLVEVLWEDAEALDLPLTLPEEASERPLRWRLCEEGGASSEGALQPRDLPVAQRRAVEGESWLLRHLRLPPPDSHGYHRLELFPADGEAPIATTTVILAPRRCFEPDAVSDGNRSWGLTTQLHAVRSTRNWGIGDFTDLTRLLELTAEAGAGTVALNPLHALFPTRPERCNPYAPSSRIFLNVLHIDVEALPECAECEEARDWIAREEFQAHLRALRAAATVDCAAVAKTKLEALERLHRHFREHHLVPGSPRADAFHAFREEQGEPLRRFALFEALCERFEGPPTEWPEPYRRMDSPEVQDFARERAARVDFFAWLQWHARQQLQGAGRRSLELRLALGLCADLAVGAAPDGADAWSDPQAFVAGVHVGAPPDDFSPKGQDWGVLPWHPQALREAAYAPFVAALRAGMREAGAVRIDHVMGLMRLFLIPAGKGPTAGTYVSYPFEHLLGVLALESMRNRCLVIGEDLGTVPEELRAAIGPLGVLSFRLLYFERDGHDAFLPPERLEPRAALSTATHDLPTLVGFWAGTDLEARRELGLFAREQEYEEQLVRRSHDRAHLLLALDHEDLLPTQDGVDPIAVPELTPEHVAAVYRYLARAPSCLLLIQAVDLLGQAEQVNLPGSGDAYPNWRIRQTLELESWAGESRIQGLLAAVRAERGVLERPPPPQAAESEEPPRASIPRATYRLQLHAGFGFAAAADLVPYLAALGVSHCYFSPFLEARAGSTHGYDVVAHDRLNPELGSREDYDRLCRTLTDHGMEQILDMVPNHVGIMGGENRWWLDVLENGPASEYADFFDIDWEPLKDELRGKVLVPVLGDHYGNVLDSGALLLVFEAGGFRAEYYEHHFPIDPREYPRILAPGLDRLRERLGPDHEELAAFESLVTAFGNLPSRWRLDADSLTERRRDKELHKQRLAELCARSADLGWYVQECVREVNGAEDYPADIARLHELLEAQAYRLAHWRVAADEINYRRFFDINDLAALRMENPDAFEATHSLVFQLIDRGCLAGLRIDHPDGLYDPAVYFRAIQERVGAAAGTAPAGDSGNARPLYLLVEKILVGEEQLPADWPVHGTTGYDFATLVDALLVDAEGAAPLTDCYRDFVGTVRSLADEEYEAKKLVMRNLLSSELHVLASELSRIAESDPHTRDYTLDGLRAALMEIVACFPVYRTYISPEGVAAGDRNQVLRAVSEARRRSRAPDLSVFGFVRDVLLTEVAVGKPEAYRERVLHLAMKLQQYTGPVTAKGVEDTALYRYHRLVSLNEVGGDPERFGVSVDGFHRACARRRERWPHGMLAGSTHDSKRSEDVRARLHVLSELPGEWREHVERWARINRRLRRETGGRSWPDPNTEYLLYQTLLGAWPLAPVQGEALDEVRGRIRGYMEKAAKEAKVHTAWTNSNAEYEVALASFVDDVLDPERNAAFFDDFLPFQRRIARLGLYNSLSQTLLRLTAPGVPDVYQGCELWSFSLVDPDNRRAVDFGLRRALLEGIDASLREGKSREDLAAELAASPEDGRAKLYLIHRALILRRAVPELFAQGGYTPLPVEGPHADRLCAFARGNGGHCAVTIAPRLVAGLVPANAESSDPFADAGWSTTWIEVPAPALEDRLSGVTLHPSPFRDRHRLSAAEVLRRFPVGLLTCEGPPHG